MKTKNIDFSRRYDHKHIGSQIMFSVRTLIENGFTVINACNSLKIGGTIFLGRLFVEMLIWIFNKDRVMSFSEILTNRVPCKYLHPLF